MKTSSGEEMTQSAKMSKGTKKRKDNNHGPTNNMTQAKAIKSARNQPCNGKINRTVYKSPWIKLINAEIKRFKKSIHGATNERHTFQLLVTTRPHKP